MKKNIEPLKIVRPLSMLLVKMEEKLKSNPDISLRHFVEELGFNPISLLYSQGFSALIYFALLVPLSLDERTGDDDWDRLVRLKNGLCHGTYEIRDNNLVVRDFEGEIQITPKEAFELADKLANL
ncbi:MAG: hypothetical protein KatS3mg052_1222 [Candidatus Roseilinea sp.]|nr:MAG: hypothetical protein KatS3mg052_1222 [Candidatus Roseilinea sp.]